MKKLLVLFSVLLLTSFQTHAKREKAVYKGVDPYIMHSVSKCAMSAYYAIALIKTGDRISGDHTYSITAPAPAMIERYVRKYKVGKPLQAFIFPIDGKLKGRFLLINATNTNRRGKVTIFRGYNPYGKYRFYLNGQRVYYDAKNGRAITGKYLKGYSKFYRIKGKRHNSIYHLPRSYTLCSVLKPVILSLKYTLKRLALWRPRADHDDPSNDYYSSARDEIDEAKHAYYNDFTLDTSFDRFMNRKICKRIR